MEYQLTKVNTKLMINSMLLNAIVCMFFLIASLQPTLLSNQPLLALQMVLAVPFLVTACIASTFIGKEENKLLWYNFGWITFLIGYVFTLNSAGIIISTLTSISLGLIFFSVSCILPAVYSFLLVKYEDQSLKERIIKDSIFVFLQLVLGVFVIVGWI